MPNANKVHEFTLKNGFKLIIKEDHRSTAALLQIFYKVGSSYESNGITGISHVLEHMMFEGTLYYNVRKLSQKLAECAVQNAQTRADYTTFYEIFHVDKLADYIELEADRMQHLLLRKKDFVREMKIIMEERRMVVDDDPQQYTYERFSAAAYLSSPYHHPIIGWMDDLKNMTLDDVFQWYKTWYVPNNAIAVIIANVAPQKIYQLVKKYFGHIKPTPLPNIKSQKEIDPQGPRTLIVKKHAVLPFFVLGYNTPVLKTTKEKWIPYALLVLCELLVNGNDARLQKHLIQEKQMILDVSYRYSPFNRMNNVLALLITPAPQENNEAVKNSVLDEIAELQNHPPSNEELNLIKVNMLASKIYEEDSIAYQAAEIGGLEAVGLSWKELNKAYEIIETITPQQIQKVAQKFLISARLIIANLEPLPLSGKVSKPQNHSIKHHSLIN